MPVLQDYFGISKAALVEAANKGLSNKFAKEQGEEQRSKSKPAKKQKTSKPGKKQRGQSSNDV